MMNKKALHINTAYFDEDSNSIFKDSLQNSQNQSQVEHQNQNQTTFVREYYHQPEDIVFNRNQGQKRIQNIEKEINNNKQEIQKQFKDSYGFLKKSFQVNQNNSQNMRKLPISNSLRYLSKKKNLVRELHLIGKQIPLVYTDSRSYEGNSTHLRRHYKLQHHKNRTGKNDLIKAYLTGVKSIQMQKQIRSQRSLIYEDILQKLSKLNHEQIHNKQQKREQTINIKNKSFKNNQKRATYLLNEMQDILMITQNDQPVENILENKQQEEEQQQRVEQLKQRKLFYDKIKSQLQSLKIQVRQLAKAETIVEPIKSVLSTQYQQNKAVLNNQSNYIVKVNPPPLYTQTIVTPISLPQTYYPHYQANQNIRSYQTLNINEIKLKQNANLYPHVKLSNQQVRIFKIPYHQGQIQKKKQQQKQQIAYYPYLKEKILLQLQQQS